VEEINPTVTVRSEIADERNPKSGLSAKRSKYSIAAKMAKLP
tara:strand:+ start:131 stop:256 length:126 start_codon:yes stop_codon:yes gene_type:complete